MIVDNVCLMHDETDIPDELDNKSISYIVYVLTLFIQYTTFSYFYDYIRKTIDGDESKEEIKVMEKYNLPLDKTIDEDRDDIKQIYEDINKVNLTGSTGFRTINVSNNKGFSGLIKENFTDLELEYLNEVYNDIDNRCIQTIIYSNENIIRISRFSKQNEDLHLNILTLNLTFNISNNEDEKNIRFKNILMNSFDELYNDNEILIQNNTIQKKQYNFYNYIMIGFIVCLYGYFVYASIF